MARGDSIFGRVDVDWHTGEKTSHLTPAQRDFYLTGLWLFAVKIRRDVIPAHMSMITSMSHRCSLSRNTVVKNLSKLDALGLITVNPDKSITVHGVKEIHQRITWRTDPVAFPLRAPYDPRTDFQKDIDRREEDNSSSPGYSLNTKTSSASNNSEPEKEEVSQTGGLESGPSTPSPNEDSGNITTLAQFKAARPQTPEEIAALAFEVIDSLSLPDESHLEVEGIVAGYPVAWTRDCMQTTRDKQLRIAEGTDTTGFSAGPLNYLAGSLSRKHEALKHSL